MTHVSIDNNSISAVYADISLRLEREPDQYHGHIIPILILLNIMLSLNRSDKRNIEAAEMRFLRPMAGYTLWDKNEVAT